MPNITQIPALRVPLIDQKTGLMSREWYRFFVNIFQLTGEGSNTESLSDLQVGPPPIDFAAVNSVFTASTAGLAPASGGGTTNFLRADGTFAAPAPAGSNTQVQFNNSGAFGASSNFTYDTGTNTFTVGPAGATTTIETLAPTGSTVVGTMRFQGKNASATNGAGGGITLTTGNGQGTGAGGLLRFSSGTGRNGGAIQFVSGTGSSTGGDMLFSSGGGTNSSGGSFQMYAGIGNAGAASGGSFDMAGGNAAGSGAGGGMVLQSGGSLGGGVGGDFQILAGGGATSGNVFIGTDSNTSCLTITENGSAASQMGFFNAAPVTQPTAVPVTAAGIHAALVSLGLIT